MVSLLVICLVLVMVWFLKSFNDLGVFFALDRVKIKAPLFKRESWESNVQLRWSVPCWDCSTKKTVYLEVIE